MLKVKALTARECEIITLMGQGSNNQTIADRLRSSATTMRHHLTSICDELAVGNHLELAIHTYYHGLACFPSRQCDPPSWLWRRRGFGPSGL